MGCPDDPSQIRIFVGVDRSIDRHAIRDPVHDGGVTQPPRYYRGVPGAGRLEHVGASGGGIGGGYIPKWGITLKNWSDDG